MANTNDPNKFPVFDTTTGKSLTLPSRPINYGIKTSTLTQSFDSGHEQRRQKSLPKRTFDLQYNVLALTEYQTIRDFFLTKTSVTPFTWTDPVEKTSFLVRFDMDTFSGVYKYHSFKPYYELQLKLMQVWA